MLSLSPLELQTVLFAVQTTAMVAVFSILLALPIGIAVGGARRSRFRLLRVVAGIYVEVFRGTSALVQLFVAIFVLPSFGFTFDPTITATVVLALNGGAYAAESARGALDAVPKGQLEAAQSLNLGWWTSSVVIVLPQAWRIMLPSFGNIAIDVLKATSLLSLVAVSEVSLIISNLNMGGAIDSTTAYVGLLVVYLVLSIPVTLAFGWLERHSSRKLGQVGTR